MVISWQVGPARQAGEVKGVKLHRRLAAGEAERGGGARDRVSDDQKGRGDHLRGALARAHPVGHAGDRGCAGARRSRTRGGGRSTAKGGPSTAVHGGGG